MIPRTLNYLSLVGIDISLIIKQYHRIVQIDTFVRC